ncbi:MAG: arginine--tRNA ligase [Spirochaetes bacterium]|nr:arginine--tRNA ligase [Spirochaetota bacterium]
MKSLRTQLTDIFSHAFIAAGMEGRYGTVGISQRPEISDFQCNGALPAAKAFKKKPREIAEAVIAALGSNALITKTSIDGPGFINITVSDAAITSASGELNGIDQNANTLTADKRMTVIDFGGPNVAKPMHVGHLRTSIIGDALQRLMHRLGVPLVSINHLGDWGLQMGMVIKALSEDKPDLPYFDPKHTGAYPDTSPVTAAELDTIYPASAQRCKADDAEMKKAQDITADLHRGNPGYRALWRQLVDVSRAELTREFDALDVHFDHWRGESYYHDKIPAIVEQMKSSHHAVMSEGALVIPFTEEETGGRELPPFMLVKSDGAFLYSTTDFTAVDSRVKEFNAERLIYVVDKRQSLHFVQLFLAVKKTGIAPGAELLHIPFGTVNGTDGKPFKTRAGGVMKLGDLISQAIDKAREKMKEAGMAAGYPEDEQKTIAHAVGIAALKFADLVNHRETDYIFDLDAFMRFEGKTGPYLLYTAVRIKSILRKAAERGFSEAALSVFSPGERELMLRLTRYPDVLVSAYETLLPSYLCEYIHETAQAFNMFYANCNIINETDAAKRGSWLSLCRVTLTVLESALSVLGISTPERM